jgi:hypothetical protein
MTPVGDTVRDGLTGNVRDGITTGLGCKFYGLFLMWSRMLSMLSTLSGPGLAFRLNKA